MTVTPYGKCKVIVNGVPIATKTKLQHLVNSPAEPQDVLSPTRRAGVRPAGLGAKPLLSLCHCVPVMTRSQLWSCDINSLSVWGKSFHLPGPCLQNREG